MFQIKTENDFPNTPAFTSHQPLTLHPGPVLQGLGQMGGGESGG